MSMIEDVDFDRLDSAIKSRVLAPKLPPIRISNRSSNNSSLYRRRQFRAPYSFLSYKQDKVGKHLADPYAPKKDLTTEERLRLEEKTHENKTHKKIRDQVNEELESKNKLSVKVAKIDYSDAFEEVDNSYSRYIESKKRLNEFIKEGERQFQDQNVQGFMI